MKKETVTTYPEIFISYSREDSKSVHSVINWLQNSGISSSTFFFDQNNIDGAGVFPAVIANAIKKCKVLIFFASKTSAESLWVKNEVHYALKYKKAVLPVFLEDVELEGELDISLSRIQQINFYDNDKEKKYNAIFSSLTALGVSIEESQNKESLMRPAKTSGLFNYPKKYVIYSLSIFILAIIITAYFVFWQDLFNNDKKPANNVVNNNFPSQNNEQLSPERNDEKSKSVVTADINKDSLALYYTFHIKKHNKLDEIFNGSTIHTGDKMQIRVKVSKDSYMYILNQDAGNNIYVLFPIDKASNFLPGNKEVIIPDENKYVEADSQVGVEKLYIIASIKPMEFINDMVLKYQSSPVNKRGTLNINEKIKNRGFSKIVEGKGIAIKNLSKNSSDFDLDRYLKGKENLFKEISFLHK